MRVNLDKPLVEKILKDVIDEFSDDEKANLRHNIKSGRKLYCGIRAYMNVGPNAGDLITLALFREFPDHEMDFNGMRKINDVSWDRYNKIVKLHTLNYYHATQSIEESDFKTLISSHIGK